MPKKDSKGEPDENQRSALADSGRYAGLGLQMAASIGFFLWLGWEADQWLGWTPALTLLGAFVGAGGGFYSIYRHLVPGAREGDEERR